eukprot:TRINITY_DN10347_c0_g1_i1.p1 TRINITY_DN10347_c0_g1~~TRINITY_DN10347_c0_g1_i1.p1  ORF type:complete len:557 (-),score=62.49 TRINITY_DN10347_c0_g1_i1:73-1710(-)
MAPRRHAFVMCLAFALGLVLSGCSGGGTKTSTTSTTSTLSTSTSASSLSTSTSASSLFTSTSPTHISTTMTTTIVAWNALCSAHVGCPTSGKCCPSSDGTFDACCGKINVSTILGRFVGVGYTPDPHKFVIGPVCDDFMTNWSEPLWGPSGRDDLQVIRKMGATAVRTYGIGAHLPHAQFLDRAHSLGLKVLPGFADYPYLKGGSACNIDKGLKANCMRNGNHDCSGTIEQQYTLMLENGYTVVGSDGKRRYHPAIHTITLINECELKLQFQCSEVRGQDANHAKIIVTALDGLLSAEDALDIVGPRPALTATVSFATCPSCESVQRNFPGATAEVPSLPQMADVFLAMQDSDSFVNYKAKHDLMDVYQNRWVNSFNTGNRFSELCETHTMLLKMYAESPLGNVPVYIGEFHDADLTPEEFRVDVMAAVSVAQGLQFCGGGSSSLVGVNIFEYQVAYWKDPLGEGGASQKFGIWGLGDDKITKTHSDSSSGMTDVLDVFCLEAVDSDKHPVTRSAASNVKSVIQALNGTWPTAPPLCSSVAAVVA